MSRIVVAIVVVFGCAERADSTNAPKLTGDTCPIHTSATSCQTDPDCRWFGTGCACPPNDPSCTCSDGVCGAIDAGSGSGSGSTGAGCACPSGGICFEQIGGTVQQAGTEPQIACAPATTCSGIQDEGTCQPSATVTGLCVCDDGVR